MSKKMKHLNHLSNGILEENEAVEFAVLGAYETKIVGSKTVRNGILAATNKRVIFYSKRMTGYDLESFDYDKISSIAMSKGLMGHSINFYASGNKVEVKWINDAEIDMFVSFVKEKMEKKPEVISTPEKSQQLQNFEEIKALKELLDIGAITQEEFDNKKKELL